MRIRDSADPDSADSDAQDFLSNDFYRQAEQLKGDAKEALDGGEYAPSIEYSRQSQKMSDRAYDYAENQFFAYLARAARTRAESAIDATDRSDVSYNDWQQIIIEDGRAFYRDGVTLFDDEEYELSASSFLNVMVVLNALNEPEPEPIVPEPEPVEQAVLPKYYRVRLIPGDRDSFSKISGYPFVFDDYTKWRELYELNKGNIVDSENPDLIHPGLLLEIPSLSGETREGEWQPPEQ